MKSSINIQLLNYDWRQAHIECGDVKHIWWVPNPTRTKKSSVTAQHKKQTVQNYNCETNIM